MLVYIDAIKREINIFLAFLCSSQINFSSFDYIIILSYTKNAWFVYTGQRLMTDDPCYRTNAELYFPARTCANAKYTQRYFVHSEILNFRNFCSN